MRKLMLLRAGALAFCFASFATHASACIDPMHHKYILLSGEPSDISDADFVAETQLVAPPSPIRRKPHIVDLENRVPPPNLPNMQARLRIIASLTHSHLVGQEIAVEYFKSSCGPRLRTDQSGYLVGKIAPLSQDNIPITVAPFVWSNDGSYRIGGVGRRRS